MHRHSWKDPSLPKGFGGGSGCGGGCGSASRPGSRGSASGSGSDPHRERANIARYALLLLFFGGTANLLPGQENAIVPPVGGGLQVRSVSAYVDYYSTGVAAGGISQYPVNFKADAAAGGSVEVGWLKPTERTTSSFNYTSSLAGRVRYSQLNSWNHALSFTTSHHIAPRWTFDFSAGGNLNNLEGSLFAPTTFGNIAATRATFDDLAAAMLSSKFNNPQLASVLTSAPLLESPVRYLLYGQKMFTSAARTSLNYSYSPRLSVTFHGGADRNQALAENGTGANQGASLILNTTSGNVGLTVTYLLSPRTQIGGSVVGSRIASSIQDAYTTTSLGTLTRALAQRWILQLHGGVGVSQPLSQTSILVAAGARPLSTRTLPAGGAMLTYKALSQTVLASIDRTVMDSYGLGAASTTAAAVTWRWRRPGSVWWMESSAAWQQLRGNGLQNTSGLRTTAGLGRNFGTQLVLFTQYAHLNYTGQLQTPAYNRGQTAMRVSLAWTPHAIAQ